MSASSDINDDEQWFDCETPADLKDGQRTPDRKSTPSASAQCPQAPCRNGLKFQTSSDDLDLEDSDDDVNDFNISGICPIDETPPEIAREKRKSPLAKKQRREEILEQTIIQPTLQAESKFSEIYYLEATGIVSINRQSSSSDEMEKRECQLLVSYRVHKEEPNKIQIALIVYKSNSKNPKTRRNLMTEFATKSSHSKCRSEVKDRERFNLVDSRPSTASPGAKAVKRPLNPMRL